LAAGTARCRAEQQANAQAKVQASLAQSLQPLRVRAKAAADKADETSVGCACNAAFDFVNLVDQAKIDCRFANDEASVAKCEGLADQAVHKAAAIKADRERKLAHETQVFDERPMVEAAQKLCATNLVACRSACAANGKFACVQLGIQIYSTKRTDETAAKARELFRAACDEGRGPLFACESIPELDRREAAFQGEANDLWRSVQDAVDEIARNVYGVYFLRTVIEPKMPYAYQRIQAEQGIQRMILHRGMKVRNAYCPAKTAFIVHSGAAEFSRRAAAHCKDEPPKSYEDEVHLTAQCKDVYAFGCP
jgi:hypothetical protein